MEYLQQLATAQDQLQGPVSQKIKINLKFDFYGILPLKSMVRSILSLCETAQNRLKFLDNLLLYTDLHIEAVERWWLESVNNPLIFWNPSENTNYILESAMYFVFWHHWGKSFVVVFIRLFTIEGSGVQKSGRDHHSVVALFEMLFQHISSI